MRVQGKNHSVEYDSETATVICRGTLNPRGKEGYAQIAELLGDVVDEVSGDISLDLRELEFLNSTGISTLGGFILKVRKKGTIRLNVWCAEKYSWQARTMKALRKLMPSLEVKYE